jgi:hypothetical protein
LQRHTGTTKHAKEQGHLPRRLAMKRIWFKTWGWIYLPVSAAGWLTAILTLLFCINTFLAIDRHSHSVSDTLYGIFPYWVPAFGILNWIASRTSEKVRS